MKPIVCLLFIVLLISSCDSKKKNSVVSDFIPQNSQTILLIKNLESFKTNIKNNSFINLISKSEDYKSLSNQLNYLNTLKTKSPIIICLYKTKNDSLDYTFITKYSDSLSKLGTVETYKTQNIEALKIATNTKPIFATIKDSILIGSSNKTTLETVLTQTTVNTLIKKQINAINKEAPFSIILNENPIIESLFYEDALTTSKLSSAFVFDATISQEELVMNGITKAIDSSSLINVFKNTIPQDNETPKITPGNSDGFLSLTFDDFEVFNANLKHFNLKDSISTPTTIFDNITEVGVIYENDNRIVALHSIDPTATMDALISDQRLVYNYRDVAIYEFSLPSLFKDTFSPFITFNGFSKYCVIDSFFVFANSTEALENIISNYQNETTFNTRSYYKNILPDLSDQASLLQLLRPNALQKVVSNNFEFETSLKLAAYKASVIQFVYDSNFAHVNAILRKDKKRAVENSVTEVLNINLDDALLNTPTLVVNHKTKQKEIVVQDIKNNLYLISNTGQILWKKQLDGPLLGRIEQLDMYKNGRLQLVFATSNKVYVIARNGKEVKPFPLTFKDEITQPLSVFDYDKNRNYRLFVTQGKDVLLYNAKGELVKGFDFPSTTTPINSQPQHLRVGSKDYIIIKTTDKLNILTRRGKPRVTPKTKLKYDDQSVFNYNGTFVTATKNGKLATVDRNGNVTVATLLGENTNLVTTTKTLVAQNEDKLKIRDKTITLDFANYSKPKLFYINNKIYVSITNLQLQKVLLFDSQAKSIANFPVYGNSTIELDNLDKDSRLEFITKGEANNILVYEIN